MTVCLSETVWNTIIYFRKFMDNLINDKRVKIDISFGFHAVDGNYS